VLSAPPIGCVPSQRTLAGGLERGCSEKYNNAAKLFNSKLSKELDSLRSYPNSSIVYIDVYNPLFDIIQNYQKYGNTKLALASLILMRIYFIIIYNIF